MAETLYGTKSQLINLIREVVGAKETGLVSVLTDTNHAVLLKFYAGKLIHLHSRTREIGDVVQVLNESGQVRFKFAHFFLEAEPELMPIESLLQLIETGINEAVATKSPSKIPDNGVTTDVEQSSSELEPIKELFTRLASEYVGPIVDMLVDEAFENNNDPMQAIEFIADMIPDTDQAASFRSQAHKATKIIPL